MQTEGGASAQDRAGLARRLRSVHQQPAGEQEQPLRDLVAEMSDRLGGDDPLTLKARFRLTTCLYANGSTPSPSAAAAATYERELREVFADADRILGPTDGLTLRIRHRLAGYAQDAGRYRDAAALYRAALPDLERDLGPDHGETLSALRILAHCEGSAGNPAEAVRLLDDLLERVLRELGPTSALLAEARLAREEFSRTSRRARAASWLGIGKRRTP